MSDNLTPEQKAEIDALYEQHMEENIKHVAEIIDGMIPLFQNRPFMSVMDSLINAMRIASSMANIPSQGIDTLISTAQHGVAEVLTQYKKDVELLETQSATESAENDIESDGATITTG